jgi:hypothetical protein
MTALLLRTSLYALIEFLYILTVLGRTNNLPLVSLQDR